VPRLYPALELRWPARPADDRVERVVAEIDHEQPFAIDEIVNGIRIFLPSAAACDRAARLAGAIDSDVAISIVDVSDEDWAERSQSSLAPIQIGRVLVSPHEGAQAATPGDIVIVVTPSMGFGTGHHASTRLCLRLLQGVPLERRAVLDVGTGSGILAIAARKLGARIVVATDIDADALFAARENLERNHEADIVLHHGELANARAELARSFDVVLANLTGALLARQAPSLGALTSPGGTLIASGFQPHEVDDVSAALHSAGLSVVHRLDEEDWIGVRSSKFEV
jgi:ribosomal protein L11 methyltransferase